MKIIAMLACAALTISIVGCSVATPPPTATATAPISSPVSQTPITTSTNTPAPSPLPPTPTVSPTTAPSRAHTSAGCPDPLAIIQALYDADDAQQFDKSLSLFIEDAMLSTWAEGVNGHHMVERHLTGKEQIRSALGNPGLRRTSDQPDAPNYHETRIQVSGNMVNLMLEPDRLRPNAKPFNPFRVQAVFLGYKIQSLTVIDSVIWL